RRGTPARVPDELVTRVGAQEAVVGIPGETVIQQLQGGRDLLPPEEARRSRQPLKPWALRAADGAERAAQARPFRPGPHGAPLRRSGAPVPHSPNPPPAPSATARRRRSSRGWG